MFKSPEIVNMLLDIAKGILRMWLEPDVERKILNYTGLAQCNHKDPHKRKVGRSEPEKDMWWQKQRLERSWKGHQLRNEDSL